jgi:hypothetical protein
MTSGPQPLRWLLLLYLEALLVAIRKCITEPEFPSRPGLTISRRFTLSEKIKMDRVNTGAKAFIRAVSGSRGFAA